MVMEKLGVPTELMKKLILCGCTEEQAMEKIASGQAEEFVKTASHNPRGVTTGSIFASSLVTDTPKEVK